MGIFCKEKNYTLYEGKMEEILPTLPENSVDCIITDPPYELNFMNKGWDNSGIAFQKSTWEHCLRVLKPGGYLLAFGGSRTFHRIAVAIEDAGFEIRDNLFWLYGSGFPKGQNIGLAIDKKMGLQGQRGIGGFNVSGLTEQSNRKAKLYICSNTDGSKMDAYNDFKHEKAKKFAGWNTNLKPAYEPIIMARKPFKGSLVDNILEYGVGGINIDECRVENTSADTYDLEKRQISKATGSDNDGHFLDLLHNKDLKHGVIDNGRYPANILHDGSQEIMDIFPDTKSTYNENGNASRYFYCAKASKKDRDEGLDAFEENYVLKEDTPQEIKDLILKSLTT